VGLLDVDLHGPSVPVLLGLQGAKPQVRQGVMEPVSREPGLKVMSVGFMLPGEEDAVIWRGPAKTGVIRQFLKDVVWGDLDFLVIDCPPGTGDEPLSLVRLIEGLDGAVVVTTPQRVAVADVRRSVGFCRKVGLAVLGVVENMSGLVCPHCGQVTAVFSAGGGERMAAEAGVPFLGRIPMDPAVVECSDAGAPYVVRHPDTATSAAFRGVAQALLDMADRPATA
jgi:Mrp family chromosome partitioning ATPase